MFLKKNSFIHSELDGLSRYFICDFYLQSDNIKINFNLRLLGVPGVVGDSEGEPEFGDRFPKVEEVVLRIVMLRVMGTSSQTIVGEAGLDKESYLRSLPRPVSGAGPASVSSQSL